MNNRYRIKDKMLSQKTICQQLVKSSFRRVVTPSVATRVMAINARRGYSKYKDIIFAQEGRDKLAKGVNVLAKAVSVTLGPKGRYVLIGKNYIYIYIFFSVNYLI